MEESQLERHKAYKDGHEIDVDQPSLRGST